MKNVSKMVMEIMHATGWTQQQLAERVGVGQPTVYRWTRGEGSRGTNFARLQDLYHKIVQSSTEPREVQTSSSNQTGIEIIGAIRAGNWLDTSLIDENPDFQYIPVTPDERFPRARQYALEVQGDSMNLEYSEGTFVICVDFYSSGLEMRENMIVHVERNRGPLREITLKMLKKHGDGWRLEPRSSNPSHRPIILSEGEETEDEVRIRGIVIGDYRRRFI
jgi:SOS-response transcriptional repressor LexA